MYALGKSGHHWKDVLYIMPAGMVNQLMSCYWLDNGLEVESIKSEKPQIDIDKMIRSIKKRKVKFNF
jgi:hypothetical protein